MTSCLPFGASAANRGKIREQITAGSAGVGSSDGVKRLGLVKPALQKVGLAALAGGAVRGQQLRGCDAEAS
jgi:hypothetical protein